MHIGGVGFLSCCFFFALAYADRPYPILSMFACCVLYTNGVLTSSFATINFIVRKDIRSRQYFILNLFPVRLRTLRPRGYRTYYIYRC